MRSVSYIGGEHTRLSGGEHTRLIGGEHTRLTSGKLRLIVKETKNGKKENYRRQLENEQDSK